MKSNETYPDTNSVGSKISDSGTDSMRGKLKIFFGMSLGVGKTTAMLQDAWRECQRGVDLVVGFVDSRDMPEVKGMVKKLEVIPPVPRMRDGAAVEEMDVDAVIRRHPYIVLVDDLAHFNAEGGRHAYRYQEVKELLSNGINVYTTLNFQQLESQSDYTDIISDTPYVDTIPDELFETADEIVLIDATSNMLLSRLSRDKINIPAHYRENTPNYFTKANIISRRAATLRLLADKVTRIWDTYTGHQPVDDLERSNRQLMVLVGADRNSERLIRVGKRVAYSLGMTFKILHVEGVRELDRGEITQLKKNIDLASELGATVTIASGNDLPRTALRIAEQEGITHILVGRSKRRGLLAHLLGRGDLAGRLLRKSDQFLIFVKEMPESSTARKKKRLAVKPHYGASYWLNYLWAVLAVAGSMGLSEWIYGDINYNVSWFIQLFVLLVLVMYVHFGAAVLASAVSALAWIWFYLPPQFSFTAEHIDQVFAAIALPTVALVGAIFTAMLRRQRREARRQAGRYMALYNLVERVSVANSVEQITAITRDELRKYFDIKVYLCLADENGNLTYDAPSELPEEFSDRDREIAEWTFLHSAVKAGKNSDSFADESEYAFYVLKGLETKQGVAIAHLGPTLDVRGGLELLWNLFMTQVSNALERQSLLERNRYITLTRESDRLYETIFNSVSHELRTPVTNIMAASNIMMTEEYPPEFQKEFVSQIYTASTRLNHLIENLLNTSRIESRTIAPNLDWCDINDLFNSVLDNLSEALKPFTVEVTLPESTPPVEMDFGLMEQVLYNLIYNSTKYATPGTKIELKAFYDDNNFVIQEMDRGPGFSADVIGNVFDKFYRGKRKETGGLGLGLTIARGYVKAHNGTISVKNREGGGAMFTITIPNTKYLIPDTQNLIKKEESYV